ncbi:EpsG family protein [Sporosarcina sp. ANT_H38]|uniref:EpsG family protein n=1 Tax=Sporosarcina sp. ANT_H38 TaxID=2597358 RepID=UPI0011F301E8|nr:EpsG family protein [Sporosarcina sp. ANT_H38]KAA0955535.1 EpsG family protein [Sporosarcina sp. ANT_H38]
MRILLDIFLLFSIIGIVFILSFMEKKIRFNIKKKIILCLVVLIALVCGNKVIGLDHENYENMFINTDTVNLNLDLFKNMFDNHLEPGFIILISIIKDMGLGTQFFFFISAIIPLYLIYLIIIGKEKTLPFFTLLLFLLMNLLRGPVDTIRHFFAAAIYLSAIYSLSKDRNSRFYLKSSISTLFHYSNVAIFLIRPFLKMKWTIKSYVISIVTLGILAFASKNIIQNYISDLVFTSPILIKFQYYLVYSSDDINFMNNLHEVLWYLFTYSIVVLIVVVNILALRYRKSIEQDKFYFLLLNSQIIGSILVLVLTAFNAENFGLRLNYLFSMGSFFIVKELIFKYLTKKNQIVFILFIIYLCLYNIIIILYFAGVYSPFSRFRLV